MTAERQKAASPELAGGSEDTATAAEQTVRIRPDPPPEGAPPSFIPATPAAFGRYEVRRPLGTGGFGTVYLGHDSQLDRPVALKVLRAGAISAGADGEQTLQEARKLAQLRHPGIVTVHDVGVHEGQVYLVSDYLDGPDLGRWLREHRPAWPEAARVASAVADALAHAHARLIVHRDVKPGNIILTGEGTPVLVDFGLALDESLAGGSEKGILSGTPWYMSPEQAAGTAHRIDGRTDIYSLGVVLYEMLTGRVPFRAGKPLELLRQVRDDEPQPPRQLVRDIPPKLESACLKAMAKRQQDRYTTAADFAAELRRILQTCHEPPAPSDAPLRAVTVSTRAVQSERSLSDTPKPSSIRPGSRGAERRQVTVLVCGSEVFDSEGYLELDAEDQAAILRSFQQSCEEAVHRSDGTIVQCDERGLVACYGFPVAYEDGARRAARTALGLLQDLKGITEQLRHERNLMLNPWVGLHTGPAIVEVKEETVALVGEARNVAVRLEDVVETGQILCSDATYQLIRGQFQCAPLGPRKLKGVAAPVELFQVQGVGEGQSAIEATGPGGLSPLTGRDHEVSLLKDRWEQAIEGMGQVVLLIGEPGLGKSRLVHTLKEHVLGQTVEGDVDAPVIEWRCAPHHQNTALYPAIEFYERALDFRHDEPAEARFDRLLHRLEKYGLARPETVPLWASLLSLPTTDRFPPLSLTPTRQREETFRAMLEWLHTRAQRRPVLFIVEDLHWVDASSLEFLGQFIAEGLHESILTVLTFRPEFQTPWPAVAHQTSLALNRLTRRQVAELMRKKAGGALPEAVVEQIYDRTGGVPLFVEEFTKMVQESGALDSGAGDHAPVRALMSHEIPATLQDLVMARLDRMEGDRELAQLAAIVGREASFEMLAAVADMDEEALQRELDKLTQAEVLYQKGRPPRCTYIFKHALLQDALYNSLTKGARQQFHLRIAEALEGRFPQIAEAQPELLAHHLSEAGLIEKAVDSWLKAGLRSRERSAFSEAVGHLRRGLSLLETLPESRERDGRELKLLTNLAPSYIGARGYAAPEVGPVLVRARELCQRNEDRQEQFGIMLCMWEWHIVRGDLRVCAEQAAEGMALVEKLHDPGMMMEALFMPGVTMFYRGHFADARIHLEKALAAYDNRERTKFWTAYTGHDAGVTHRCYLALTFWHLGYPDQAQKLARETCELARTIGHAFSLGHAVDFAAYLSLNCRLGAETRTLGEEEAALGAEQGLPFWHALGKLHQGMGMLLQGHRDSLPLILKGFTAFRATGAEVRVPAYLGMLGDAYTQSGNWEQAHKALSEGLAVAKKNDDRCHEAELHRLKGELLLAESTETPAAEVCFRQAIETARRQASRAWELRATMSLARLWLRQGRRAEARATLAAVYGTYTEGFTTPDLADARELLEALE